MESNMICPIAIRLSGTKERKAGFAPLINIGVLPGDVSDNMDKVTLVTEKPSYIIKHTPDYIYYGLIDRQVKSFNADGSGILSLALAIRRGQRLAGGRSPYDLLREFYDKFVETYMTRKQDGRDEYNDTEIDDTQFRAIMEKYPTEDGNQNIIPMNGLGLTGTLRMDADKLADLFRDSQYQEFAQFREIEIGLQCTTSPTLESVRIPRPIEYRLFVDGVNQHRTYTDADEKIIITKSEDGTYKYDTAVFLLKDLTDKGELEDKGVKAKLDITKNRIDCNTAGMKKTEIEYEITVENGIEKVKKLLEEKKTKIVIDGYDNFPNKIPASKIETAEAKFTVEIVDNMKLSISRKINHKDHKIKFTVSACAYRVAPAATTETKPKATNMTDTKTVSSATNVGMNTKPAPNIMPVSTAKPKDDYEEDLNKAQSEEEQKKKRRNKKIAFSICMVLAVLAGVGGTLVVQQFTGGSKATVTPQDSVNVAKNDSTANDTTKRKDIASDNAALPTTPQKQEETAVETEIKGGASNVVSDRDQKAEEAKKKAEELRNKQEEQQKAAKDKEKQKAELLELVKSRCDIQTCRNHAAWKIITKTERIAIENVLYPEKYNKDVDATGVRKLLNTKKLPIANWNDVKIANNEILEILKENKKQ